MSAPIGADYADIDNDTTDFAAAKQAGARFVIPQGVYGRPYAGQTPVYKDKCWSRDKDRIHAAGLKRSGYLFLCYPRKGYSTPEPEVQADQFADYVQLEPFKDYVPMFDVEETSDILSAAEMYAWTLRCALRLRQHYGVWPGMYTSARVWAENLDHHSPGPLLNCPLWLAKPWPWNTNTPVHLDGAPAYSPTLIPEFSNQWFIYQYQGDAIKWPGFSHTVDADRMRVFGKGAKGAHVVWSQKRLGITADGVFGDKTEAAVKALQSKYGLTPDGYIGVDTFAPLGWSNPAPAGTIINDVFVSD